MFMYKQAIIIPGFSESKRFAAGLESEVADGPFALAEDAFTVRLGDALDDPEKYADVFAESLVITHSAGILAVHNAAEVIALNGPEPTKLTQTIKGAAKIAFDKDVITEEGIIVGGMLEPALELARHPIHNVKIPFKVRHFSTARHLISYADGFVNGRSLFTTDQDQFGFTRPEVTDFASVNGIFAKILLGKHNHAMFQPRDMLRQITEARKTA